MSQSKNRRKAERWLQTAEEDLRAAELLMQGRAFAQACFYSQQSGEKAVKALWYRIDADPWGHSVQRLGMLWMCCGNIWARLRRSAYGVPSKWARYHKVVGGNFCLDALQAAMLRAKLRYLDDWTAARQRNAEHCRQLFAAAGVVILAYPVMLATVAASTTSL
jgi:dTDP-4-amino-4,6-dideoxygalactose transaminase